jgi:hypothetical protein
MNAGATESLFNATFIRISLGQRKAKQLLPKRRCTFQVAGVQYFTNRAQSHPLRVFVTGKGSKRRKDKHWEQYIGIRTGFANACKRANL